MITDEHLELFLEFYRVVYRNDDNVLFDLDSGNYIVFQKQSPKATIIFFQETNKWGEETSSHLEVFADYENSAFWVKSNESYTLGKCYQPSTKRAFIRFMAEINNYMDMEYSLDEFSLQLQEWMIDLI
jgi:hypothetical protein